MATQPPVTGGNSATSSPGFTGWSTPTYSWLTATRTIERLASAAACLRPRGDSQSSRAPTVRDVGRRLDLLLADADLALQPGEIENAHAGLPICCLEVSAQKRRV